MYSHRRRLESARQRHIALRNEIGAFFGARPYRIQNQRYPARPEQVKILAAAPEQLPGRLKITPDRTDLIAHVATVHFDQAVPLDRWTQTTHDVVHDLRVALDHLVYAVAVHESGTNSPPDWKQLMFPIASDAKAWAKSKNRIATLSPAVQQAIEALQPFKHAKGARPSWSLHIVNEMDIRDKHRFTVEAGINPNSLTATSRSLEDGYSPLAAFQRGGVQDGSWVWLMLAPVEIPEAGLTDVEFQVAVPGVPHAQDARAVGVNMLLGALGADVEGTIRRIEGQANLPIG